MAESSYLLTQRSKIQTSAHESITKTLMKTIYFWYTQLLINVAVKSHSQWVDKASEFE